jgi:hypothetical protein
VSPAILPRSPQLCQNGGLSVLSSVGESESAVGGSNIVFGKKFPGEKGRVRQFVV